MLFLESKNEQAHLSQNTCMFYAFNNCPNNDGQHLFSLWPNVLRSEAHIYSDLE